MRNNLAHLFYAVLFSISLFSPAYAESDIKEGYDENTEITIRGSISLIRKSSRGPVILRLSTPQKSYDVITAPPRYLTQEGIVFTEGDSLEIVGSKYFGDDGNLYMISSRITFLTTGRTMVLRDADYRPLWRRNKRQQDVQ